MGAGELSIERRPQWASWKDLAVAETAPAIDHQHGKVLVQRGILEAVVHHDDTGASGVRSLRPLDAVMRDDRRCHTGEQERLVAHVARAIPVGCNKKRAAAAPAARRSHASGTRAARRPP